LSKGFPAVALLKQERKVAPRKQGIETNNGSDAVSDAVDPSAYSTSDDSQGPSESGSECEESDGADDLVGGKRAVQRDAGGSAKRLKQIEPTFIWRYRLKHHLQTAHGANADTPCYAALMKIYDGVSDLERSDVSKAL
jgi:hypothetical protein